MSTFATYAANPTSLWSAADILTTDKYKAIAEKYGSSVCYIKTDVLKHDSPIVWRGKYHTYSPAPVWVTGHSDYGITPDIYDRYKDHCKTWFALNKETPAANIISLPLGRTNDCDDSHVHRIIGNTDIMFRIAQEPKKDINLVYMNFSRNTFPQERGPVYTMFAGKSWVTIAEASLTHHGSERFLRSLRNHTFTLCPRGNGVDTHRLWEALYMGSIPIVKRNIAVNEFADLPICWIDTWDQVTPEFLAQEYQRISSAEWNLEKLKIGYWETLIGAAVKSDSAQ